MEFRRGSGLRSQPTSADGFAGAFRGVPGRGMAARIGALQTMKADRHVLVVENELVIGLDLADGLSRLGFQVAGPFGLSTEALAWLDAHTPDVAILDLGLADGSGIDVARDLRKRGVPFVVFSGASHKDALDRELSQMPWVEKPAALAHVLDALELARAAPRRDARDAT